MLEWNDSEGRNHSWPMPMELLKGDGCDYRGKLLSGGLDIAGGRIPRELLTRFIQSSKPSLYCRCVDRVGWHGGVDSSWEVFVLPTLPQGRADGEQIVFQTLGEEQHFFRESGSLEDWKGYVAGYSSGNSRLVFALSLAFAGPLLSFAEEQSGGFHLQGISSVGKTTAARVAGSAWGGGGPDGFCHSWRATSNGLEAIAAQHNDGLLVLDELAQVDPREAAEVCYMLANESGKGRANRMGAARKMSSWRLVFLSTGEIPLAEHIRLAGKKTRGGQEVRLINLPADAGAGLGVFENTHGMSPADFSRTISENSKKYYGTAIPIFVHHVRSNRSKIPGLLSAHTKAFIDSHVPKGASGEIFRAAGRFALVAAAGCLASKFGITGWNLQEADNAAATMFKSWLSERTEKPGEEEAAIRQVRGFLEAHGSSRFQKIGDEDKTIISRAGFVDVVPGPDDDEKPTTVKEFWILPEAFRNEVCIGFDYRMVAKALLDREILQTDDDGKTSARRYCPGLGRSRVYIIRNSIFADDVIKTPAALP
jgi:putative DNA primase/helicase